MEPAEQRISDLERQQVAEVLRQAAGEGRIEVDTSRVMLWGGRIVPEDGSGFGQATNTGIQLDLREHARVAGTEAGRSGTRTSAVCASSAGGVASGPAG
jgi:hypothetical protein